ncbi:hypothetical protein [Algivirga pacifica]|uniref:Uncharacterized protein n=1 Tax=Algivirga pacifica TaxID=1162670 RepID=A0ABP9D458_9BACT
MKISTTFFNGMSYEKKIQTLYNYAEMLVSLVIGDERIELYCIGGTYLEVIVKNESLHIADIRVINDSEELLKYCEQVDLKQLI